MNYTLDFHIDDSLNCEYLDLERLRQAGFQIEKEAKIWIKPEHWPLIPHTFHLQVYFVESDSLDHHSSNQALRSCYLDVLGFSLSLAENPITSLFESLETGCLIFNNKGQLVYSNQSAHSLLDLSCRTPLGLYTSQHFQWADPKSNSKSSLLDPGDSPAIGSLIGPSGKEGPKVKVHRKSFNWKKHDYTLLEFNRIEDPKHSRQELQQDAERNKLLLERNFGAFFLSDAKGIISYTSGETQKISGYTSNELVGQSSFSFIHPDDHPQKGIAVNQIKSKPEASIDLQYRLKHRDGTYRWVDAVLTNHLSTPGINAYVSVLRDIHQQKVLEEQLRTSIQRFQWASKATKDVIWDWNFKAETIVWGENLQQAFGWQEADLNTTQKWMDCVHPEDHQAIEDSLEHSFANNKEIWECYYRFRCSDGQYAHIYDRGFIARDKDGSPIRLIGAMHDYSLRNQRESELKSEQLKFKALFEGSLIGVAQLNLKTLRWQECNQALLNMLGYKASEFKGMLLRQLIVADHLDLNNEILSDLRADKKVRPYQTMLLRKDEGSTKVVVSAFAFSAHNHNPIAWFHFLDLGPIEESNKALVEAETRFRSYIEKASDLFATLDDKGQFDYISPNVEQLLGYRPNEITGVDNLSLIHPKDLEKVLAVYAKAWSNPIKSVRTVFRFKHKNGHWLWLEVNGSFQSRNNRLKAFLNIRDIQKEHQTEAELRKLSLVANSTSNGVLILGPQFEVEWFNDSYAKMSAYSLEEAKGKNMVQLVHGPKSLKLTEGKLQENIASGKPFVIENINYRKNGGEYWVESRVTPIFDDDQKLSNYISIEIDISERKQKETSFQKNMQLIAEQNERLRSFAHIVSHNFRSHGSNIQQISKELMVTGDEMLKEELHKFLDTSATGLMEALDELSSLLKVDSASDLPTEELSVLEYCERVRQILARQSMEINAELQFDIPPNFKVQFYPAYLESVLFNLISNALRYHDPEKEPWVKVWLEDAPNFTRLFVADNGLGIDMERHGDEIFKYRKTVHNHPDSSGIGLYLIRSQIESLGGEISFKSRLGEGSTFCISIPK